MDNYTMEETLEILNSDCDTTCPSGNTKEFPVGKIVTEYVLWLEQLVKHQSREIKQLQGSAKDMARIIGEKKCVYL